MPPALVYNGDSICMDGLLPGPLSSNLEDLSTDDQAEYRLLANRLMLPTYVTRAWADGAFDLRESLVNLRSNWAAVAGSYTPRPIKFSTEEMMEHERQLEAFRCYEATVAALCSALHCEGDGWVPHENYNAVREVISDLEGMWDVEMTGSPFPFKDGEHSYFLS